MSYTEINSCRTESQQNAYNVKLQSSLMNVRMWVDGWSSKRVDGVWKLQSNKSTVSQGPFTNYSQLHFGCSAVWMKSKMTGQEQIQNNKHNFLRNNWIAPLLKKFSLQTVEWKWHDILSISGRPPSHHRLCLAISVLTAPLIRPDTVLNSRLLFFFRSQRKTLTKLLPLDHAALLLIAQSLSESLNSMLKATADEMLQKWHILEK